MRNRISSVEPDAPPRLMFCGDPHRQFKHILRAAAQFNLWQ